MRAPITVYALAAVIIPSTASAFTIVQFFNLFNIFAGLYLTATCIVFGASLAIYFARLGTWPSHRDTAVKGMEWGVVMLFVLVVLVALVQFFDRHSVIATTILSFVIIAAIVIAVLLSIAKNTENGEKKEE